MSVPTVALGSVIRFIRGVTFKPDDQVEPFSEGSAVVMRTKNVQVEGLDTRDLIAVPKAFVKRKEQYLQEGDILISSANSWELVGKASFVDELDYESTAGGFISIVRPLSEKIDPRYLYHWITSPRSQHAIRHCGRQTTNISNLDAGRFKELTLPLPPLKEQQRIAAILDKADAIRRKRQQAIALADEFLRAVFLDMFGDPVTNPKGWDVESLDESLIFLTSGSRGWAKYYSEKGSKFIRIQNVGENKLYLGDMAYVNAPLGAEANRTRVELGDVLLSITADLGRSSVVTDDIVGGHINQHLALLRVNQDRIVPRYLSAFLSSESGVRQFRAKNKSAVKAGLNFDDIKTLKIAIPPLHVQREYEHIYQKTTQNLKKQEILSRAAGALVGSLGRKAFSGEL